MKTQPNDTSDSNNIGPMFAALQVQQLTCKDTGEANDSEPYLWAVYFKIDDLATYYALCQDGLIKAAFGGLSSKAQDFKAKLSQMYPTRPTRDQWLYTPGGAHGNICAEMDEDEKAKATLNVPLKFGYFHCKLDRLGAQEHALVGCVAVFLEEDSYPDREVAKSYDDKFVSQVHDSLVVGLLKNIDPEGMKFRPEYAKAHPSPQAFTEAALEKTIQESVSANFPWWFNKDEFLGCKVVLRAAPQLAGFDAMRFGKTFDEKSGCASGEYVVSGGVQGWASPLVKSISPAEAKALQNQDFSQLTAADLFEPSRVAGYAAPGHQHAFYVGSDNHVHELWHDTRAWRHNDVTREAGDRAADEGELGAKKIDPSLSVFCTDAQRLHFLRGEGDKAKLFEYSHAGQGWKLREIATQTPPAGRPAAWPSPRGHCVAFVGADKEVHLLTVRGDSTKEFVVSLSGDGKTPDKNPRPRTKAPGNPCGYAAGGLVHVFYTDGDGALWCGMLDGSTVLPPVNLTLKTGAPKAASDPTCFYDAAARSYHAFYRGADNNVHEISLAEGSEWGCFHPSTAAGAPPASGTPFAYVWTKDNSHHVAYRGADGDIYELFYYGRWKCNDLTKQAHAYVRAAGDPVAWTWDTDKCMHVVYVGTDEHLHELVFDQANVKWIGFDLFKSIAL